MSVTESTELFLERPGHKDADSLTINRTFRVLTDDRTDTALTVFNEGPSAAPAPLPQVGDVHPDEPNLIVAGLDPKIEGDDGQIWKVKVSYIPTTTDLTGIPDPVKPWEKPPLVSYGFIAMKEVLDKCYDSGFVVDPGFPAGAVNGVRPKEVTNSAAQPFDPPLQRDKFLQQINIQTAIEHVAFNVQVQVRRFMDTVNKSSITVGQIPLAPGQGYCRNIRATPAFFGGVEKYWTVVAEVVVNEDTWVRKVLDQGRFTINESETPDADDNIVYDPIENSDGNPVTDPVLLDGAGIRLNQDADAVFLFAHDIFQVAWSSTIFPPGN